MLCYHIMIYINIYIYIISISMCSEVSSSMVIWGGRCLKRGLTFEGIDSIASSYLFQAATVRFLIFTVWSPFGKWKKRTDRRLEKKSQFSYVSLWCQLRVFLSQTFNHAHCSKTPLENVLQILRVKNSIMDTSKPLGNVLNFKIHIPSCKLT